MNIDFITVSYNSTADIYELAESITRALPKNKKVRLFITDNSDNFPKDFNPEPDKLDIYIIHGQGNIGYARGNNIAINRSKALDPKGHCVLINPDARIPIAFFPKINKYLSHKSFKDKACIALNVKGTTPYLNQYTPLDVCFPYLNRILDKISYEYIKEQPTAEVYRFHGCALIVNKMKCDESFFDPNTFLYYEEDIFAHSSEGKIPIFLSPCIEHVSGASTASASIKQRYKFISESLDYFLIKHSKFPYLFRKILVSTSTVLRILRNA